MGPSATFCRFFRGLQTAAAPPSWGETTKGDRSVAGRADIYWNGWSKGMESIAGVSSTAALLPAGRGIPERSIWPTVGSFEAPAACTATSTVSMYEPILQNDSWESI